MDSERFDLLTRTLSSRRTALGGLLGAAALLGLVVPEGTIAHNLVPACHKLTDPVKRARCLQRARTHRRRCHSQSPAAVCAGRCGTWSDRCGKRVACAVCATPKLCLSNGGCSQICGTGLPTCPAGCLCQGPDPDGKRHCLSGFPACDEVPLVCASNANCPVGSFCFTAFCPGPTPGSFENRCVPLCSS